MQNNVTELTDKLLRALDTNYNVTNMQTVIDIIILLDKVAITKEVLEATRLGKHVNELRRNTSNDWLAKRAKELVKKWRNLVLPPIQQHPQEHPNAATINNGQLKQQTIAHAPVPVVRDKVVPGVQDANTHSQQEEGAGGAMVMGGGNKKRSAKEKIDTNNSGLTSKRPRMNGGSELDLSDTSNSSFHDAVQARYDLRLARTTSAAASAVIQINSDSNSSLPEVKQQLAQDTASSHHSPSTTIHHTPSLTTIPILTPPLTSPSSTTSIQPQHSTTSPTTPSATTPQEQQQQQRRRGRRKGSSAHRSLLDEADASFTSKMARGANARVKTTQELVASLQGRGSGVMVGAQSTLVVGKVGGVGVKEDLVQKAAKLTERVSIIDQKLNTNANRYKNNGGSTNTNKHHHNKHNNNINNNNNNNNNNSLSNMGMSEANDDIIVVDEDDFSTKQQRSVGGGGGGSGRHRKRRDSAGNREHGDNVTIKHEEDKEMGGGGDGQEVTSLMMKCEGFN